MVGKKFLAILALLLAGSSLFSADAAVSMPYYNPYPTITLSSSGAMPIYSGKPLCTQIVNLSLLDNEGAAQSIDSVFFVKDTLHVVPRNSMGIVPDTVLPKPDIIWPGSSYKQTVFHAWGTYVVVLHDVFVKTRVTKIGTVLIYPSFTTTPSLPITTVATRLDLTLGQSHTPCNPTYGNMQTRIKGDTITLKYTEALFSDPCIAIYLIDPVSYGTSFDLGLLNTGTYVVKVDTMTLGAITIAAGYPIIGTATAMKNPLSLAPTVSIANALVSGIVYNVCPFYSYSPLVFDTVTTTTNASGSFSMLLPRANKEYTISGEKAGYYTQRLPLDASQSAKPLSFQLIPTTMDTLGAFSMIITNNGSPVESVYVSLNPGRMPVLCPMYDRALSKQAALQTSMSGYTNRNGSISLDGISLVPFIDFAYSAGYYKNGPILEKYGRVRLNPFTTTTITMDFGATPVSQKIRLQSREITKNIIGSILTISDIYRTYGSETVMTIYNAQGRNTMRMKVNETASVNLSSLAPGSYVLRIVGSKSTTTGNFVLQ